MNHYELLVRWGPNHTNQLHDPEALLQAAWCSWLSRQGHILMVQPLDLCLKRCEQNNVMQHHNVLLQIATPTYNLQTLSTLWSLRHPLCNRSRWPVVAVGAAGWWGHLALYYKAVQTPNNITSDITTSQIATPKLNTTLSTLWLQWTTSPCSQHGSHASSAHSASRTPLSLDSLIRWCEHFTDNPTPRNASTTTKPHMISKT